MLAAELVASAAEAAALDLLRALILFVSAATALRLLFLRSLNFW